MSDPNKPGWESAKQRTRRIKLDFYRRLTKLDLAKWSLAALAAVICGGYVLGTLVGWISGSESASQQFSPGPVASVHQAWDGKCATCHVQFAALRADATGTRSLLGLVRRQTLAGEPQADEAATGSSPAQSLCQHCHMKFGSDHHRVNPESQYLEQSCAGCHIDHRGVDADLTRVADGNCLSCHADLAAHAKTDLKPITGFGKGIHPEFALPARDPGQIKFNHVLHMLPWQYPSDAKIDPRHPPSPIEQLTCASCHQTDNSVVGDNSRNATEAVRYRALPGSGDYMLPIRFEQHCSKCHSRELTVSGEINGQLPHGLTPAGVREQLVRLAGGTATVESAPLSPKQPIPGKTPGSNLAQKLDPSLEQKLRAVELDLWSHPRTVSPQANAHCAKCHEFASAGKDGLMPAVKQPQIAQVWLPHARFDHAAHRGVKCQDCHQDAQAVGEVKGNIELDHHKVMIPQLETCAKCHAPRWHGQGGARHDCAECHRYHGGSQGPHSPGSDRRSAPQRTLDEFIQGPARGVN